MTQEQDRQHHRQWAQLRFSIVGPLLSSPPKRGQLGRELILLSRRRWRHPTTGEWVTFGVSTIERWYYQAKNASRDPLGALRRQIRKDQGRQPSLSSWLIARLLQQHKEHPGWTRQLHYDNLIVQVEAQKDAGALPSYSTVLRFMKRAGLVRQKRRRGKETEGQRAARARLEEREVRGYEVEYVLGLWHLDFHEGSRKVLTRDGRWRKPMLLGVLDDHSRLCCHLQWYLDETAETLIHGLMQAIQKRGLPRALMTDNGSAMRAQETQEGLTSLSILHQPTLAYSPYQNGKQESFWGQVEGRLLPMLEGEDELILDLLNEATQAWVELEYNRKPHSEIGVAPLRRFLDGKNVGRMSPSSEELRRAFRARLKRKQRRSDGTISLCGVRFEVPSRFRHLEELHLRFARWDLQTVELIDPQTDQGLCRLFPQDKAENAEGQRRTIEDARVESETEPVDGCGIAPLLKKLMADYAATGLPPAYLPKRQAPKNEEESK